MMERALDAGVPVAWVPGDAVYGDDRRLRLWLEQHDLAHVLAVKATSRWCRACFSFERADQLAARIPAGAWRHLSAGHGTKGERLYDWARVAVRPLREPAGATGCWCAAGSPSPARWPTTSVRPGRDQPGELAQIAGRRWTVECGFQQGKGETGLDHYEVRS